MAGMGLLAGRWLPGLRSRLPNGFERVKPLGSGPQGV